MSSVCYIGAQPRPVISLKTGVGEAWWTNSPFSSSVVPEATGMANWYGSNVVTPGRLPIETVRYSRRQLYGPPGVGTTPAHYSQGVRLAGQS